jgi:hypothetical protein
MTNSLRVPGHDAFAVIMRDLRALTEENSRLRRACTLAVERLEREETESAMAVCNVLRAGLDGTL